MTKNGLFVRPPSVMQLGVVDQKRRLILYAESITINTATSTAESAHGVFAYVAPPFSVPFC